VFDPAAVGVRTGIITYTSNDLARPVLTTQVTGTGVTPNMTVSPASLDFGSVLVGSAVSRTFVIANTGNASLTFATSLPPGDFGLSCPGGCNATLLPFQAATITVWFAPTSVGIKTGTVMIVGDDPARPVAQVTLTGVAIAPGIAVTPNPIAFGVGLQGTPTVRSATISNTGTAPLTVSSAVVPPGYTFAAMLPRTIAVGATYTMQVTCTRATQGDFLGDLVLGHDAGRALRVPMSCTSAGAMLELVSPASGELLIRPGDVGTVRVRNTGPAPLELIAVGFSDGPSSWFTHGGLALPTTLAAGAEAELTVTCEAQWRSGIHWEKLLVKHDGYNTGSLLVVGCDAGPYEVTEEPEPPGFPSPLPPLEAQ